MRWACEKSATGHALAPAFDKVALWSGWQCSHCGERFKRPRDSDSYELPLMDSVVEVDELALMLDGTCHDDGDGGLWVRDLERCGDDSWLSKRLAMEGMNEGVAQAILELEGAADNTWSMGPLALKAWHRSRRSATSGERIIDISLEAAAKLRDGWRPGGEP